MCTINQESDEIAYRVAFGCQTKDELVREEYIVSSRLDRYIAALYEIEHPVLGKVQDVDLWLSPSDHSNFRYAVANIPGSKGPGYKAGRPEKPVWLAHIKDRMKTQWGAKEIQGYEADDALGIYQTERTIASHIDKDINMIPGWHYNHVTEEFYNVPEGLGHLIYENKKLVGRGTMFFYAQLLIGDSTDNIPGITGVGLKKAFDSLHSHQEEEQCLITTLAHYQKQYGEDHIDAIFEIADLIWICRKKGETGRQYLQSLGVS